MRPHRIAALAAPILIALLALPAVGDTTPTPTKRKRTPKRTPTAAVTPAASAAAAASAPAPVPPAPPTAAPAAKAPAAKAAAAPTEASKPAVGSGASSADVGAGKALYDKNCKKCHGAQGEGVARMYALVDAKIVHLGSKQAQSKTDAEIVKSIIDGVGKMEAVEDVTPAQAKQITAFMRTLKIE